MRVDQQDEFVYRPRLPRQKRVEVEAAGLALCPVQGNDIKKCRERIAGRPRTDRLLKRRTSRMSSFHLGSTGEHA
jgi:hypothetical protein